MSNSLTGASRIIVSAIVFLTVFIAFVFSGNLAFAVTSVSYDFDTEANLDDNFDRHVNSGTVQWSATGGINNTGAINAPASADAVFTSKAGYSLAGVGSSYTFESFIESVGNSGYSGMGFTSKVASAANAVNSGAYRMNDALGVSVHGGGFIFHNGNTNTYGNWNGSYTGGNNLFTVTASSNPDGALVEGVQGNGLALLNGHRYTDNGGEITSKWYKLVLQISVVDTDRFNMRVEAYRARSNGTLVQESPDAVYELRNIENETISSAPTIRSYISFSGDRVRYFDNFQINLLGGSTVINPGSPVVLTTSIDEADGDQTVNGSVSSDGGSAVTERGFVYSTQQNPTTSDQKVVVAGTTGSYSTTLTGLAPGTYYVRAFATNSNGTSYGVTFTFTIENTDDESSPSSQNNSLSPSGQANGKTGPATNTGSWESIDSSHHQLAKTGPSVPVGLLAGSVLVSTLGALMLLARPSLRPSTLHNRRG